METNKKILLVDDEEGFLAVLRDALEVRGFGIVTATSAIEAGLELASKKPDLILMDIKMPGINGLQACGAIKKNAVTAAIPIIAVSALSDDNTIKDAYKSGVSDYFVKPIDIEKLVNRIKQLLKV